MVFLQNYLKKTGILMSLVTQGCRIRLGERLPYHGVACPESFAAGSGRGAPVPVSILLLLIREIP